MLRQRRLLCVSLKLEKFFPGIFKLTVYCMPARTSVSGVQMMMQTLDQGLGGPDAQVATTSHQLDIERGRLE